MARLGKDDVNVRIGATDATKDAVASAKRGVTSLGDRMQAQSARMITAFAKIGAAIYAAKKAFDWANEAAKFEQSMKAFETQVSKLGMNATAEFEKIRRSSAGLIDDKSMVESANRALSLGIPLGEIGNLMEISRAKARDMGETTTQMFDDIVKGIGRGSPMILDNLGLMIKLGEVNEQYAASIGKTVEQLTEQEKKQALLNAVMEKGSEAVARHNLQHMTTAERIQKITASMENLKLQIGAGLIRVAIGAQAAFQWLAAGALTATAGVMKVIQGFTWLTDKLGITKNASEGWAQAAQSAFDAAGEQSLKAAENMQMAMSKSEELVQGYKNVGQAAKEAAQAQFDWSQWQNEMIAVYEEQWRQEERAKAEENEAMMLYAKAYYADQEVQIERKKAEMRIKTASGMSSALSKIAYAFYQMSDKQSKAAFKAYQAFAIAEALVSTYKAAAMALSAPPGPPWSLVYVAMAIAQGLAQVKAIMSQKPGGGAAVAPGGGGASYSPTVPVRPAEGINAGQGQGQATSHSWHFNVEGWGGDEDSLVEKLKEAMEDAVGDKRMDLQGA